MKHFMRIIASVILLYFPISLMSMEPSQPILPNDMLQEIRKYIESKKALYTFVQSSQEIELLNNKDFKNDILLPTSFGSTSLPIITSNYWPFYLNIPKSFWRLRNILASKPWMKIGFTNSTHTILFPDDEYRVYIYPNTEVNNDFSNICVDVNGSNHGFIAYPFYNPATPDNPYRHRLLFFSNNSRHFNEDSHPNYVTALTMYPGCPGEPPRVVYLTEKPNHSSQHMVVAEKGDDNTISIMVSAPTPATFTMIAPFDLDSCRSHFALSDEGKLWKVSPAPRGTVQYSKQKVYNRSGQQVEYTHIATNAQGLLAALKDNGEITIGDPRFQPQPISMHLATISEPEDVIRFSHIYNSDSDTSTIHAVYEKPWLQDSCPVLSLTYSASNMYLHYYEDELKRRFNT